MITIKGTSEEVPIDSRFILPSSYKMLRKSQLQAAEIAADLIANGTEVVVIDASVGFGKAQPLSEPVLTPSGFKTMGVMSVGEIVFGEDGYPCKVIAVHPQGSKDVYTITFNDGSSTKCCLDHLWKVRIAGREEWKVISLSDLLQSKRISQFHIPICSPVKFPTRFVPMDPYILGVLLGDGSLSQASVSFTSADQEIVDEISKRLPESLSVKFNGRYGYQITSKVGAAKFSPNPVNRAIQYLGLKGTKSGDKFIPPVYKYSDYIQRLELLHGLMDTDGCNLKGKAGTEYCSKSKQLAEDVVEIVNSLGGVARISSRFTGRIRNGVFVNPATYWRVNVKLMVCPFKLKRKADGWTKPTKYPIARLIKNIEKSGTEECQCISVDSPGNTYLTKNCIVTHNSMCAELVRQLLATRMLYVAPKNELIDQMQRSLPFAETLKGRSNYPHGGPNGFRDFKKGISCAECQNQALCKEKKYCSYHRDKDKFMKGKVSITNTAYYLVAANYLRMFNPNNPSKDFKGFRGGNYLTVFDECLIGESLVYTSKGEKRIDECVPKTMVYGWDGSSFVKKPVTNLKCNGFRETKIVTLSNGRTITGTDNHPILTTRGWVEIGDLKTGDTCIGRKNLHNLPEEIRVHGNDRKRSKGAMQRLPFAMDFRENDLCLRETNAYSVYREQASSFMEGQHNRCDYIEVVSIQNGGLHEVYDISVKDIRNFLVEGVVAHNCDTLADSMLGFWETTITQSFLREVVVNAIMTVTVDGIVKPYPVPVPPVNDFGNWMSYWIDVCELIETAIKRHGTPDPLDVFSIAWVNRLIKMKLALGMVECDWIYDPERAKNAKGIRNGPADKVTLKPKVVGEMGKGILWDYCGRTLCMSGSIINLKVFAEETGLDLSGKSYEMISYETNWDKWRRTIFRVGGVEVVKKSRALPWSQQTWWEQYIGNIAWILNRHPDDRYLIHAVSHDLAKELGKSLGEIFGNRILVSQSFSKEQKKRGIFNGIVSLESEETADRDDAMVRYLNEPGKVLISASLSRGTDLPYAKCRGIIIAKCPWKSIGDRRIKAILETTESGKMQYLVWCVRDILQSLGRGVRCFSMDTEILTTEGWKNYQEIEVGTKIYGIAQECFSKQVPVQLGSVILDTGTVTGKVENRPESMLSIKSKGIDALVTLDHSMVIQKPRQNKHTRTTVKPYGEYDYTSSYKLLSNKIEKVEASCLPSRFKLTVAGKVSKRDGPRLSKDWFFLMGVIISDGGIHKSKNLVTIHQAKPENFEAIHGVLVRLGIEFMFDKTGEAGTVMSVRGGKEYTRNHDKYTWYISGFSASKIRDIFDRGATRRYSKNKSYNQKSHLSTGKDGKKVRVDGWKNVERDIPRWLISRASVPQMKALISGLMLGDGTWATVGKTGQYYSSEKRIVDHLQEVFVLSGFRSSLKSRDGQQYEISFVMNGMIDCAKDKCVSEAECQKSWCVSTDIGTVVVRRNGKTYIAGNSADDWCRLWVVDDQFDKIVQMRGLLPNYIKETIREKDDYLHRGPEIPEDAPIYFGENNVMDLSELLRRNRKENSAIT